MSSGYVPPHELVAGDDLLRLDTNESPYEIEIEGVTTTHLNRYVHDSHTKLLEALAEHHLVEPEQIVVGNGSSQILKNVIETFGRNGGVAVLNPSYRQYKNLAETANVPFVEVSTNEQMRMEPEYFLQSQAKNVALQIISNPNNPTGAYEEIDPTLTKLIKNTGGVTAIDETYIEFAGDGTPSATELLEDEDQNIVVIRTFSKAYAAANIRVGYGIMGKELAHEMRSNSPLYPLSGVQEQIALQLLAKTEEVLWKVDEVIQSREKMEGQLAALGCRVIPSEASFILFGLPEEISADETHQNLIQNYKIVVRSMNDMPRVANMLRVSIGTPEQNERFIAAMKTVLQNATSNT